MRREAMVVPKAATYVVIGAGVHGLSTAYHLGRALREKGQGRGADIVLLEKKCVGAGASGIACGVVRNFYYQPAMNEIMRLSVGIWEEHADVLGDHPVGYIAAVPAPRAEDLVTIAKRHAEIGVQVRDRYRREGLRAPYDGDPARLSHRG